MTKEELLLIQGVLQWSLRYVTTIGQIERIGSARDIIEREIRLKELAELLPKEPS